MEENRAKQEGYVIPPPDLPPPSLPPTLDASSPGDPANAPGAAPGSSQVNVRIRDQADPSESEPQAGGFAPFNSRIIAALIDIVLAAGLQLAALWILPGFANRIAWLVGLAYLITRDSLPFLGGQSVGKKAMKLKVVTLDGKSLAGNWEPALIRNGVLAIPFFPFIELFILLTREDKPGRGLRLGDEWAKTKVIIAEDPPGPDENAEE